MYNVYVNITDEKGRRDAFFDVDKINFLTIFYDGTRIYPISGGQYQYATSIGLKNVISSIGQAKKISEQNNVSVILDLKGQVPKIEQL